MLAPSLFHGVLVLNGEQVDLQNAGVAQMLHEGHEWQRCILLW